MFLVVLLVLGVCLSVIFEQWSCSKEVGSRMLSCGDLYLFNLAKDFFFTDSSLGRSVVTLTVCLIEHRIA